MTADGVARPQTAMRRRAVLPTPIAYVLTAYVIGLALFASVAPSPLYSSYMELWHFSSLTLTLIYATYAFGVLVTLILAGRLSDDVGRRPVLLLALGSLMAATVLFVFADSPLWLFLARFLQGVATGAAVSSASAAMLDLHPRRDAAGVSFANGVASSVGIGLGVLASSALVQLGEAPRVLPYVVLLALLGIAVAGVYWMPESVSTRRRLRLTVERPSVPSSVRRPFLLAGLAVLSSWSIGGLFFSLGPELGSHVFHSANVIVSGIGVVALSGAAALAQVVFRRVAPWLATALGSAALGVGMSLIVLATHTDSSSLYLTSCIVGGVGFGVAFVGGLSALVIAIPSEHRAAVMSAFYLVAYGSLSIPAVVAGAIVDHVGLQRTFESFGVTVSAIALIVTVAAWQTRPEHGLA